MLTRSEKGGSAFTHILHEKDDLIDLLKESRERSGLHLSTIYKQLGIIIENQFQLRTNNKLASGPYASKLISSSSEWPRR